jgi:hypothetical protein
MDVKYNGLVSISFLQSSIKEIEKKYLALTYQVISLGTKTLVSSLDNS